MSSNSSKRSLACDALPPEKKGKGPPIDEKAEVEDDAKKVVDEASILLSPSKIKKTGSKIDLHAMVSSLSPMKKKHFFGELVDEEKSIRFVGFNPAQRMQLNSFNDNKSPVLLKGCDVQLNQYSNSLEVLIKGYTKITQSTATFAIEDPSTIGTTNIQLDQLPDKQEYDKVNIKVKVIEVNPPQVVNSGKTKQDVIVGDKTGTATLTLWEKDVDTLKNSESYSIQQLMVRVFNDTHYLSLPETATVKQIDDMHDVSDAIDSSINPQLEDATICGVKDIETFKLCFSRTNGKVIPSSDTIGECQKCHMTVKLDSCTEESRMAKVIVNGYDSESSASKFLTLVGYGSILNTITQTQDITKETLLNAKPFNVTYNAYFVIMNISR